MHEFFTDGKHHQLKAVKAALLFFDINKLLLKTIEKYHIYLNNI